MVTESKIYRPSYPFILCMVSPDNLSMSMFSDFLRKSYLGDYPYEEITVNCLLSSEAQENLVTAALKDLGKKCLLIRYKIKTQTKLALPEAIKSSATFIVKFDIYSSHPEILKSEGGDWSVVLEDWERHVRVMEGGPRQSNSSAEGR